LAAGPDGPAQIKRLPVLYFIAKENYSEPRLAAAGKFKRKAAAASIRFQDHLGLDPGACAYIVDWL
jgi:hypothetical protein